MHPSPAALLTMTTEELRAYDDELRELAIDETFNGPYRTRRDLIEAILAERKYPIPTEE